ncbi:MAG: glycosyltransferase family 2 protein [Rhodobacteraceae bacterium]|nr:glycosyltransferase family 2 protein [Paracoccaceae bacterium]
MTAPRQPGSDVDPARILVAVPTLNEASHIETMLESLIGDDPAMRDVTVVVADGGSTDGTPALVRDLSRRWPNLVLIANPEVRQAAAVNRIVAECAEPRHDFLVRTDAHAIYCDGYVMKVARTMQETKAEAVATVMDSIGYNCFQKGVAAAFSTVLGSGGSDHRGGRKSGYVDHGHNAGFRLDAFRAVGGYDTGLITNEDADLDHRIGLNGGRIWLDADIRLSYIVRDTPWKLARQYWRYGRGRGETLLRHRMRPRLRQLIPPVSLLANLLCLLLAPLFPWLIVLPQTYVVLVLVTGILLALREASICVFWSGPALAIIHLSWGAGLLWQVLWKRRARA